jgi:hypothetical protein
VVHSEFLGDITSAEQAIYFSGIVFSHLDNLTTFGLRKVYTRKTRVKFGFSLVIQNQTSPLQSGGAFQSITQCFRFFKAFL